MKYEPSSKNELAPFALRHLDESFEIYDFRYSEEDARMGNPYNTSFWISVVSGDFSGKGDCEYDIKEFVRFAHEINEMYALRRRRVELNDICYGSQVVFEADTSGHIKISGKIFGLHTTHILEFEFETDQTSLLPFARSLKQVFALGETNS